MAREKSFQDILNEYLVEPQFEAQETYNSTATSDELFKTGFQFPFHKIELKDSIGSKSKAFKIQFAYKANERKVSEKPKEDTRPKKTEGPRVPELHILNLSLSSFEMIKVLYKELGETVPEMISRPSLKRVYRKLAKQTHPDLANQLDSASQKKLADKFSQIKEFYLSLDQELKARLDEPAKVA